MKRVERKIALRCAVYTRVSTDSGLVPANIRCRIGDRWSRDRCPAGDRPDSRDEPASRCAHCKFLR